MLLVDDGHTQLLVHHPHNSPSPRAAEFEFQCHPPSLLAAGILLAARKALVIRPLWSPPVAELVAYSEEEVVPVMMHIWRHYVESFPTEASNQERQACDADRAAIAFAVMTPDILPAYYSTYAAALVSAAAAAAGDTDESTLSSAGSRAAGHHSLSSSPVRRVVGAVPAVSAAAAAATPATPLHQVGASYSGVLISGGAPAAVAASGGVICHPCHRPAVCRSCGAVLRSGLCRPCHRVPHAVVHRRRRPRCRQRHSWHSAWHPFRWRRQQPARVW